MGEIALGLAILEIGGLRAAKAISIQTFDRGVLLQLVAFSGDYDFQFMVEELAVGAQFKLPYIHIVVNNAYLGLIRQAQRGFDMDYCVQLSFENINSPEIGAYGVDFMKVAEGWDARGFACFGRRISIRVSNRPRGGWRNIKCLVIEIMLERVTNISMGTEIDNVMEFEDLAESPEDAPSAVGLLASAG